ncbi:MAG: M20/M25/M40 family metallo-hydrolase [Bryobacterales bacterium]
MLRLSSLALSFALAASSLLAQPSTDVLRQEAQERAGSQAKLVQEITDSLFSFSELGYQEFESAKYVTDVLAKNGFRIKMGAAGMPTAFVAEWGSGKPVIGLMADIDGLPETSQKPGIPRHEPLIDGGPGHGEGHNAGQAVQVTAALAAKQILEKYNLPGTIRVYPGIAEELLGSRTYMVRDGLFRDLDAMLSAHVASSFGTDWESAGWRSSRPSTPSTASPPTAGSPWKGRSALDAVELMDIGWNFRREHLRPEQRSHYVISHGGDQPNVVPPIATVWYFFRELDYEHVKQNHDIGTRIANAAAMMTDTTMTERIIGAAWQGFYSKPIAERLSANIAQVGMPAWSDDDQAFAKATQKMMDSKQEGLSTEVSALKGTMTPEPSGGGSDDIAEVSWAVPTVVLRYPSQIPGMVGHHWSSGIAMATPIAHKGPCRRTGAGHDVDRAPHRQAAARGRKGLLRRADQGRAVGIADPRRHRAAGALQQGTHGALSSRARKAALRPVEVFDLLGAAGRSLPDAGVTFFRDDDLVVAIDAELLCRRHKRSKQPRQCIGDAHLDSRARFFFRPEGSYNV